MRRFVLQRDVDETGVSGAGPVADGVVYDWEMRVDFADGLVLDLPAGWVRLTWRGEKSSTSLWKSIDTMLAVHGHNGLTRVVWADDDAGPVDVPVDGPGRDRACA